MSAHFSNSCKSSGSKVSPQPTSTRILIPPSSSRIDWEAFEDDDWAPNKGVNVNMFAALSVQKINNLGERRPHGGNVVGKDSLVELFYLGNPPIQDGFKHSNKETPSYCDILGRMAKQWVKQRRCDDERRRGRKNNELV